MPDGSTRSGFFVKPLRSDAGTPIEGQFVVEAVLAALSARGLPAVGHTLGRLTQMLENDDQAPGELANVILADMALTQRLLHLANTIPFRTANGTVTTVTRAIALLGFDRVKAAAVSLVLLDGLLTPCNSAHVHGDVRQSLLAGRLARDLLVAYDLGEAEEAGIAAMFRSVGRILLAVYAPDAMQQIRANRAADAVDEAAVARRLLGVGFDELTSQALRLWHVPERIVAATAPLIGRIAAPRAASDRIRAVAQVADDMAAALRLAGIVRREDPDRGAAVQAVMPVLDRHAAAVTVEPARLDALLSAAFEHVRDFEIALGFKPLPRGTAELAALEGQLPCAALAPSEDRDALGRPANARALMLAGISEVTELLARAGQPAASPSGIAPPIGRLDGRGPASRSAATTTEQVLRIVLETLQCAAGFERVAYVGRDGARGVYLTRIAVGIHPLNLCFPLEPSAGILQTAAARGTDIYLGDITAGSLRDRLPDALYEPDTGVRSILWMPLAVGPRLLGAIYADRTVADPAPLGDEDLQLLRTLRAQALLALRGRSP